MFRKILALFSLVGVLLSLGLWVTSFWGIERVGDERTVRCALHRGRLTIGRWSINYPIDPRATAGRSSRWVCTGFHGFETNWALEYYLTPLVGLHAQSLWIVRLPLWIPTLLFGAGLLFACARARPLRKRTRLGLCLNCGYDLTGTPDRCPECNTLT